MKNFVIKDKDQSGVAIFYCHGGGWSSNLKNAAMFDSIESAEMSLGDEGGIITLDHARKITANQR